jgi:hypothetical protein
VGEAGKHKEPTTEGTEVTERGKEKDYHRFRGFRDYTDSERTVLLLFLPVFCSLLWSVIRVILESAESVVVLFFFFLLFFFVLLPLLLSVFSVLSVHSVVKCVGFSEVQIRIGV